MVFFSLGKVERQSLSSFLGILLFFEFVEGTKTKYPFFPRKSLKVTHSVEWLLPVRNRYFCTLAVFFCSAKKLYYFFFREVLISKISRVLRRRKEKTGYVSRVKKERYLCVHTSCLF